MFTVEVNVSQEDINTGKRRDPMKCPVTLAIKRSITANWMSVGITAVTFEFTQTNPIRTFSLSTMVSRFIRDFDSSQSVQPFNFVINLTGE